MTACLHCESLQPGVFLDFSIINLFLLNYWLHHSTTAHARFVDAIFSGSWQIIEDQQWRTEVYIQPRFRRLSFLPLKGPSPFIPIIFVVRLDEHFFVVLLDYPSNAVYVISRTSLNNHYDNWDDWNGYGYYTGICNLHSWEPRPRHELSVFNVSWAQNGVNCGPFAVCIILGLMQEGVNINPATRELIRPTYICPQYIRLLMLRSLRRICADSCQSYLLLRDEHPDEWVTWDSGDHHGHHYNEDGQQYLARLQSPLMEQIHHSLVIHTNTCRLCRGRTRRVTPPLSHEEAPSNKHSVDRSVPQPVTIQDNNLSHSANDAAEPEQDNDELDEDLPLGAAIEDIRSHPIAPNRNPATLRYREDTWLNVSVDRFPRPTPPISLPDPVHPFWPPNNMLYDDYETCPTTDDFPPYNDTRELEYLHTYHLLTNSHYQRTSERSTWTQFVDYGFRRLPRYAKMFYINEPMLPLDHILSIGTRDDFDPTPYPGPAGETYSLSRGLAEPVSVHISDIEEMGLEDMLSKAGYSQGSDLSRDIFVCGRNADNEYIRINPEVDGDILGPENIDVIVDIDSLIWVTDQLVFGLSVKVHLTPSVGAMSIIRDLQIWAPPMWIRSNSPRNLCHNSSSHGLT